MKSLNALISVLALVAAVGCSNHNRTSGNSLTAEDVQAMLQDAEGAQASAAAYKDKDGVVVYAAQAPGPKIRVANILSFYSFEFIGDASLGIDTISEARVLFIDSVDHESALIIGIKANGSDQYTYSSFTGNGTIGDGEFTAELSGNSGAITLKSYDVIDGDLSDVIQLKLYFNGEYLGKVSTLTGFTF